MRRKQIALSISVLLVVLFGMIVSSHAQKKDYLTDTEADKIRDSGTPDERIRLFISFANDRIKKLQYELAHPGDSLHRADRLNALINGYTGCMDDAADLIDLGVDKQQDIHGAIKEMQARAPEFLSYLKEVQSKNKEVAEFKDNLDDAIDSTNDAFDTANSSEKEVAPPPVRRRPQ